MGVRIENARFTLANARQLVRNNVESLTPEEVLFAAGGYRSIVGVLKHMGGWVHVYRSYAPSTGFHGIGTTSVGPAVCETPSKRRPNTSTRLLPG